MIARIHFEGIVKKGKKKSVLPDYIDIHVIDLEAGKLTFESWVSKSIGLRGHTGIFHPIGIQDEIKFKSIKEGE